MVKAVKRLEIWREVHFGFYEVSDLGNVRRAKPGISTFVGRPVLATAGATGYDMVLLSGPEMRRTYVHHLVAEAFIGPRPDGHVVNHLDGIKKHNAAKNLEYVTRSENSRHAARTVKRRKGPRMTRPPKTGPQTGDRHWSHRMPERIARGASMPHCKLSPEIVRAAKARVLDGEKQCAVARDIGISVAQMSRIMRGTRWTYL